MTQLVLCALIVSRGSAPDSDGPRWRIVGGGIVGIHAGDLVGELALAIEMGCHPADLEKTIHPHPTLCESLGLAASVYQGVCTELPKATARSRDEEA